MLSTGRLTETMVKALFFIILLPVLPAFADIYSVGYLTNLAGTPTGGEQSVTIYNVTGPVDCAAYGPPYSACTNLNFTDWTLTVNYASDYYNQAGGPVEPAPFVFTDGGSGTYGGFGDISAGNSLSFAFDLCAGAATCSNPYDPDTQITSVEFSGQISPASFCLYDATFGGCNPITPTTFFANPNFNLVWNAASSTGGPYVNDAYTVGDYSSVYAQSPDITVTNQSNVVTPEPNGYLLTSALLLFAPFARRLRARAR